MVSNEWALIKVLWNGVGALTREAFGFLIGEIESGTVRCDAVLFTTKCHKLSVVALAIFFPISLSELRFGIGGLACSIEGLPDEICIGPKKSNKFPVASCLAAVL